MSNFVGYLADLPHTPFAQFLLDATVKATVLLLMALAATALLRRSSAAVRHRVWCLTFAALLLLPGLSAALPEWRLAVLPYSSPLAPQAEPAPPKATPSPIQDALARRAVPLVPQADGRHRPSDEEVVEPPGPFTAVPLAEQAGYDAPPRGEWVATLWLLGALVALLPLVVGSLRTLYLQRSARPIDDARWTSLLDELRECLALSRRVHLYETEAALMPMTWGVLRPVVMLPRHARDWTDRLRRFVLLHELAHVKRCDVGFQLLGRAACALYWFHPLAWYALRRLRIERELACDDCVVLAGERATDYAAELLQIARSYRPIPFAVAVAMAQRSNLEHRLRALFDRACSHLPVSAKAARLLLAAVLGLVTTIAAVRLAPRAAEADDVPQPGNPLAGAAGSPSDEDDAVTVSGKVVDPQGKPFPGAKLYAVRWYWEPHIPHPPLAETKSDDDGRFTISYRKSQFTVDVGRMEQWKEVSIVATADGFGPGWVTWRKIPRGEEATLRLVTDDVPIAGRVVDLEGKPVGGVAVRMGSIDTGKGGNLDAWLAAVRRGEFPWTAVKHLDNSLPKFDAWPSSAVTGDDGRFRVSGLGRERRVDLSFSSPSIAYQEVEAVTRRSDIFPLKFSRSEKEFDTVYGAEFELVAPPTQPITGIVRDAETRQPLAGVSIESNMFAGSNFTNTRQLRAMSDEQGRYRLVGMPKGAGNRVLAVPNDDQPYLMRDVKVPDSRGLEPVNLDIDLHRGIWITGRITDRTTGKPLVARLHYLPFLSNEYAQKTPEFGEPGSADSWAFQNRYVSRPDGSYRLVGLPGRAIVGAECVGGHYRKGVGADGIAGMDARGHFKTHLNPVEPGKKWPNAMKEINPPPDAEEVVCDLALDPGEKVTVNVVDADGKLLEGFETQGSGQSGSDSHDLHGSFDVITLGPEETRTVIIRHKERKLGKVIRVRLAEHPSRSFSVTVEPTARIVGRLFDREGTPVSGAAIEAHLLPMGDFSERLSPVTTDAQGHFEYTDVPTGCHYELNAQAAGMKLGGWFAKDVAVVPGETKDLGDVVYGDKTASDDADKKAASTKSGKESDDRPATPVDRAQANAAMSGVNRLRGRVVDEKGQPVVGARVRMYRNYWISQGGTAGAAPEPQWLADTRSDANGRFSAEFKPLSAAAESQAKARGFSESIGVFATAEGFGFGLRHAEPTNKEVELRLVPDSSPIEGRLLDLEGRPVRGAQVTVRAVAVLDDEPRRLNDWLDEARESGAGKNDPSEVPNGAMIVEFDSFLAPFPKATTGDDGRFTIAGIGADRVAYLEVKGPKIASTWLPLVTRPIEPLPLPTGLLRFATQTCYGSRCDIVAVPEQPIRGAVRDAKTGQPVEGAEVRFDWNDNGFSETGLAAKTDAEGRYQLSGLPKPTGDERDVAMARRRPPLRIVPAPGQPYFRTEVRVPRGKGLDAVTCDVPLRRAVTLSGQITDRKTGQPVRAAVRYYPFLTNDEARRYPNFEAGVRKLGEDDRYATDDEGRFIIPALPGRGVLTVAAERGDRYMLAEGAEAIADFMPPGSRQPNVYHLFGLNQDNAVREVDIPAEAQQFSLDVRITPLPVTRLLLVDEEGNELPGVETQGLAPRNPFAGHWSNTWREPLPTASAELIGPEAGETRETLFLDRAHNLGAMVRFTSDDIGLGKTNRIVLHPCGSVRGRVVDGNGQPVAGAWVGGEVLARESRSPAELRIDRFTWRLTLNGAHADADGRFEMKGVPPGARYAIEAYAEKRSEKWRAVTPEIKSGATVKLGDVAPQADGKQRSAAEAPSPAPADSQSPNSKKPSDSPAGAESQPDRTDNAKEVSSTQAVAEKILRGRVLLPDGKAAAGAELYWTKIESSGTQEVLKAVPRGTTNDEGRFEITLSESDLPATRTLQSLFARKAGYGIAWLRIARTEIPGDITLQLAEDLPIRGRVMDTEGRPIRGAQVSLARIQASRNGNLDAFLLAWKQSWRDAEYTKLDEPGAFYADFDPLNTVTNEEGQFEIFGAGVERVAFIEIRANGYAYDQLHVVTRQSFDAQSYNEAWSRLPAPHRGELAKLAGPQIEHVMTAELIVRGKVLTGDREPVAGASLWLGQFGFAPAICTVTDVSGRYELRGHPRGLPVLLTVDAPEGSQLLDRSLQRETAPTETALDVDVELQRGVFIEGRVFDQTDGKGVRAGVQFVPLAENRFAEPDNYDEPSTVSDDEGRFRLLVMPGPGVLMAAVMGSARIADHQINSYRQASFSAEDSQRVPTTINGDDRYFTVRNNSIRLLTNENAVKVLDLAPDSKSVTCDLPVDRGKTVKIQIEDEQGEPVKGAFVSGVTDAWPYTFRLAERVCTIYGLGSDLPRRVCLLHPERRLAASITLTGEEQQPVKVRLAASASISGRALAPDGQPLADALVQIRYAGQRASEVRRFSELEHTPLKTDAEGRFLADNIVPGERFSLDFKSGQTFYREGERRELTAGQKLNLGDATVKPVR